MQLILLTLIEHHIGKLSTQKKFLPSCETDKKASNCNVTYLWGEGKSVDIFWGQRGAKRKRGRDVKG